MADFISRTLPKVLRRMRCSREFVDQLRDIYITPHLAQNETSRRSAIDGRTTRYESYAISQRKHKRIEEVFGWLKTIAL